MTLFELSSFACTLIGAIAGAAAGSTRGVLGIILGGAGGLVIGQLTYLAAMSPMGLMSLEQKVGLRARFDNALAGLVLFVLAPLAPVGAGFASWWLVHLMSGV